MSEHLVGAEQIQDLLGVDRSTVYRMAHDGRLPAVKVGRQWRFPLDEVQQRLRIDSPPDCDVQAADLPLDPVVVEPLVSVVAEALGVMMVVADMRGTALFPVVNPCPWFVEHGDDPEVLEACTAERRELAASLDFTPRFRPNQFGYECARAFIRSDVALVGMVVGGGVAPGREDDPEGLHHLDERGRARALEGLSKVAAALSCLAGHVPSVTAGVPVASQGVTGHAPTRPHLSTGPRAGSDVEDRGDRRRTPQEVAIPRA